MKSKYLVLHMPVIHKGYLDFFKKVKDEVSHTYIINRSLLEKLSQFKPDIASLDAGDIKSLLEKMGFSNVSVLSESNVGELLGKEIILVKDEISRHLAEGYFAGEKIAWKSVFLRWDKERILVQENLHDIPTSKEDFDIATMKEALKEAEKSSEWWRRIGAVLVKDKEIILRANNMALPSDHTPYQVGEVRDFFVAGGRQDLAHTIHGEQYIVAQAAKEGVSTEGLSLYVTTFPCPVCAKLIACSGIKEVYFGEGGSNFNAKKVLDSAGVKITYVPINAD